MQMGGSRRSMEFIEDRKARNASYKKRYIGLENKAKELSTLCGIKVCMVVYGPQEVQIWPSDPDNIIIIQDLLNKYRGQPAEEHRKKNVGVSNYFEERKKKSETKLESLRRKNNEAKFPNWHAKFDSFLETDLTVEANTLNNKIEYMKMKRDLVKEDLGVLNTSYGSLSQNQNQNDEVQLMQNYLFGDEYPQPLAMIKPQEYPQPPSVNQMMVTNIDNNFQHFGGQYPRAIAMDPMMPMIDYSFQPFGGEYYCNNFPDHQLNYDQMDPLTIRGPSSEQYFNDPPELDYNTPLLTYSQIDSAATIDPALPQSFYGTDMSSSMDSSQLLHPYINFQGKNY